MIVNYFKFVDHLDVTRYACVVDGQAFYCSSGTSSGLNGAWLPFKKFGPEIPCVTGRIHKPDIAYSSDGENIRKYFPPGVANALEQWHEEDPGHNNWGRFGDMKCLLISCMLSDGATVPANIRRAVIDYVGENNYNNSYLWARPTIFDCGYMLKTRKMDDETIDECNAKLIQLGAVIPEDEPFDPANLRDFNQPRPDAPPYPEVHQPAGLLQQFIDRIPGLVTRAMRFCRRYICGEPPAPQAANNAENPIQTQRTRPR